MNRKELNLLSKKIIGCAIEVHKLLGPGLLESAYQVCIGYEFDLNRMKYKKEYAIPLFYKGKSRQVGIYIELITWLKTKS